MTIKKVKIKIEVKNKTTNPQLNSNNCLPLLS